LKSISPDILHLYVFFRPDRATRLQWAIGDRDLADGLPGGKSIPAGPTSDRGGNLLEKSAFHVSKRGYDWNIPIYRSTNPTMRKINPATEYCRFSDSLVPGMFA
jgi:hypothetical protein